MKNKTLLLFAPLFALTLTSCGNVLKYKEHLNDYVYKMDYHSNFNILQLTDIHWNANTSTHASKIYLEKTLKEADKHIKEKYGNNSKIDIVELTGDQFMLANTYHIETFLDFFEEQAEKYDFSYVPIWGNHDRHGIYSPNWLARKFKNSKHCIYIELNDDLYGRSNFVINLMGNDKVQWQLSHIDSGASFSESSLSPFRDYDYIRKDQTDWYVKENELTGNVPVIAYYHIPQQDNLVAFNERKEKGYKNKFFKLEGFGDNGNEKYASDFIKTAKDHNLKGAFMGHAHNVDWTVDYDGVVMGLGVKTGPELYYAHIDPNSDREDMKEGLASLSTPINERFDLIGASLVTLTEETNYVSGAFNLEHLYLNERKTGDFISWQEW